MNRQLCTRMGAFLAQDQPGPVRPVPTDPPERWLRRPTPRPGSRRLPFDRRIPQPRGVEQASAASRIRASIAVPEGEPDPAIRGRQRRKRRWRRRSRSGSKSVVLSGSLGARPVGRRQRLQRRTEHLDVIGGGVRCRHSPVAAARPELPRRRCPAGPRTPATGAIRRSCFQVAAAFSLLSE